MNKKTVVKEFVKNGIGIAVGAGTWIVTEGICEYYAPAGTASAVRKVMYKIGTRGLCTVTSAVATDLTLQELDKFETGVKVLRSKKSKPEMKVVEKEEA